MGASGQGFRLVLASGSPRRRELLTQAGYTFDVQAADVDESVRPGEPAAQYVERLAREKAGAVWALQPSLSARPVIVLGADTTVVCDGEILGKPSNAQDAKRMLRMLSGRVHQVLTGLALVSAAGVLSALESTDVTFSDIREGELVAYCGSPEPLDKAGAYGIQGYAARWIPRIDGDYFNVMGLPIARVVRMIEQARLRAEASR